MRHFRLMFISVVLAACLATVPAPGLGERDLGTEVGHSNHSHLSSESDEPEWTTWYEDLSSNRTLSDLGGEQRLLNDATSRATKGTLRALVVNVGTPTRAPVPRDLLSEQYTQASTRIRLMSRGMASVEVDIFGRDVIVPDVANICTDYATMSSAARDAIAGEVSLSAYRSIDFILPMLQNQICDWAGRAQLGGNTSWNIGIWGDRPIFFGTIVHEWGHQYTLPHLRAIRCTKDGQDVHLVDRAGRAAGQCATAEYGGAFSIMGESSANDSAVLTFGERAQLGWLRDGEERKVHEGVFTLGYDGPLSLLWLQNSEGDLFQIEFVKAFTMYPHGFMDPFTRLWHWLRDTPNFTHPGVMVKYISHYSSHAGYPAGYYADGYVIDATTQTILSTDAAFQAGTSFVDPTGSLTVEILSVTDQSAEVRVRGVPHKPGLVKLLQATATDTRGVFDVLFEATVTDPPVTHYEIQVSNSYNFANPQTFTVSASPGRVIIPNHTSLWTIFRVAALNSAGRGEFSWGKPLYWPKTAKWQGAAESRADSAKSVVCKKKQKVRTFALASCPSGWRKIR